MLLLWAPEVKAAVHALTSLIEEAVAFRLPLPLDHHHLPPSLSPRVCGSLIQNVGGGPTFSRTVESSFEV